MRKTFRDRLFSIQEYFATLFVSRLRRRVFAVMIVVAVLAGMFLFSNKGVLRRWQLASEKQTLEVHLNELQHQQDSLRALRDRLQRDSFMIEKVAREQYGLVRPGETIYRADPKERYAVSSAIGIDVGGTFIKGGRVTRDGTIAEELRVPSRANEGTHFVIAQIVHVAKVLASSARVEGIGIGMPGLVSNDRNTVKYPPNFEGWTVIPLATKVAQAANLPVIVDNDANCAAIGEAAYGAGREIPTFVFVTLGTGVGGGIIVDGKIFRGETGGAGEIGHTTIDYNGPPCNCGSLGCVEAYAGNRYFCERVAGLLPSHPDSLLRGMCDGTADTLTPEIVVRAAEHGDVFARAQLFEAGFAVGVGIANTMGLFDIHTAIIGGGVSQAGDFIFSGVRRAIAIYSQKPIAESHEVRAAVLGNTAGIMGAARLVFERS